MTELYRTLPQLLHYNAEQYPLAEVQRSKDTFGVYQPVTYCQLNAHAEQFAGGLLSFGVTRGDTVGLIADNRKEWQVASMGIMMIGCADVPRGCDATCDDLLYILRFSGCKIAVFENAAIACKALKSADTVFLLKIVILLTPPEESEAAAILSAADVQLFTYADVCAAGRQYEAEFPGKVVREREAGTGDEVATIIFTSGTTGEPKGIPLIHRNFLVQLPLLKKRLPIFLGDRAFCILPIWHSYQRTIEYLIIFCAGTLCYSKPVSSVMLSDLHVLNPAILPSIPRVWENMYAAIIKKAKKAGAAAYAVSRFFMFAACRRYRYFLLLKNWHIQYKKPRFIVRLVRYAAAIPYGLLSAVYAAGNVLLFNNIRTLLGTCFRFGISGGGALPPYIDTFFNAIGIRLLEGYGLTETAPIVSVRPFKTYGYATIGTCLECCETAIISDSGMILPPGETGTLLVKGVQVMSGYYRRPDLTAKVMSADGWFDTGDLAVKTYDNELIIRGRKKDTIVLRGGENVEPVPIETRIMQSPYISRAVVVGQDERFLGALIIPEKSALMQFAKEHHFCVDSYSELLQLPDVIRLYKAEIEQRINSRSGFKLFEKIGRFILLDAEFQIGKELSAKQDVMHYKVADIYKHEIKRLFSDKNR